MDNGPSVFPVYTILVEIAVGAMKWRQNLVVVELYAMQIRCQQVEKCRHDVPVVWDGTTDNLPLDAEVLGIVIV